MPCAGFFSGGMFLYIHCLCSSDMVMSTSSNSILLASRNRTTSCCFFLIATKPEHEATKTRTTILSLRQGSPLTRSQKFNATEVAADSRATVGEDRSDASGSRRSADESPAPPPRAEREAGGARRPRGLTGVVVSLAPRVTRHCAPSVRRLLHGN